MKHYVDSRPLVSTPEKLLSELKKSGYLFVSSLVSAQALLDVRKEVASVLQAAGWLDDAHPAEDLVARKGVFCVEPNPEYREVWYKMYRLESLHDLAHHHSIYEFFSALLGDTLIHHPRIMIRAVFPRSASMDDFSTPSHQDYPVIQGTPDTYTLWMPLGACPEPLGPLVVAPGTHTNGILDTSPALGAGGTEVVGEFEDVWTTGPFTCGDAAIFHSHTVHKALPNLTGNIRLSIDFRYQRVREPMNRFSIVYGDNHLLSWPLVYSEWKSRDRQFYWEGYPLSLVDFDWSYFNKRDDEAMAKACNGDKSAISVLQRIVANGKDEAKRAEARKLLAALEAS